MTSVSRFNIALVLLYCVWSAAGCRARGQSAPRAQANSTSSAVAVSAAEPLPPSESERPPSYGWAATSYALNYRSTIAAFTRTGIRTSVEGRLEVADVKENDKLKVYRLSGAHAGAEAFGKTAWQVPIEELETPFYVLLDEAGKVRELMIAPNASLETRGVFDAIACSIQAVRPPQPAARWQTLESDGSGNYRADYRAKSKVEWEKRKTSYVVPDSASGPSVSMKIGESATQIAFDAQGRIARVKGKEVLISPLLRGQSEMTIDLGDPQSVHPQSREPVPNVPNGYARYAVGIAGRRTQAERDEQLAQGVELRDIAVQLATVDTPGGRAKLRERLAAKARVTPSVVPEIGAMVRNADQASRDLVVVLSATGSSVAQLELVGLVGDVRLPPEMREAAAFALGTVTNPTRELFDAALQLYEHTTDEALGRTIGLSCGGIVKAFKGTAPEVERTFAREMEHLWRSLPPGRNRENLFLMLANAATSQALPMLQQALRSGPVAERILALQAMRTMDAAAVVPVARKVMVTDEDENVRVEAVAIAKRGDGVELRTALAQVARTDKSKTVRQAAEQSATN